MSVGIKKILRKLKQETSGNATLIVAIGMPALVGGAGLAVDTAQWYMWKRELQYAVDQAAIAAAWARTSSATNIQNAYKDRAEQEYNANLATTKDFDSFNKNSNVTLAMYGTTTVNNSVIVTASATKTLPFSSFLTNRGTTVAVRAQAKYTSGTSYSACMLAVDPHMDSAFKLGGSVTGSSTCGSGSLSDDANAAMKEAGNTSVPLGTLVATGGIDEGFKNNGTIHENQGGLVDPYASLATPTTTGSNQTYSCPTYRAPSTTITADGYDRVAYTYTYFTGPNRNNLTALSSYTGTGAMTPYNEDTNFNDRPTTNSTVVGWQPASPPIVGSAVNFHSQNGVKYWYVETRTSSTYFSNIDAVADPGSDGIARPQPGIYSSISIACTTQFAPGIYFINGTLDFGQNQTVTGSDIMFVFTSASAQSHINSNSVIDISGITKETLMAAPYNYSESYATKMASMLFFDKVSSSDFTMNGNSRVKMDGTFYMPLREAKFNGNSTQSGKCIMIASKSITFLGNDALNNFCVPANASAMNIGGGTASVTLVG